MSPKKTESRESLYKLFQFPAEGSYLHEAVNGKRTPLMNEGLEYEGTPSNSVPVRLLEDFTFFDPRTLALVSLSCLSEGRGFCEAFGRAFAESDEEDWDDRNVIQDDGVWLHISNIMNWSLDIYQEKIWVLTEYAWYILQMPSHDYRELFLPFYTKETMLRVVLRNILEEPALTLKRFLRLISLPAASDYLLDRCWTKEDLETNFQYSHLELQDIIQDYPEVSWEEIKDAPLLDSLLQGSGDATSSVQIERPAVPRPEHRKRAGTVTPTVHSLISSFFEVNFPIVGQKPDFLKEPILFRDRPQYQECTDSTVILKPGDFVLVNEGNYWEESNIRYAQIVTLDSRKKKFHARWFIHGSRTVLEDLAFGPELFLSIADACRTVSVDCVVGKCKVVHISLQERSNLQWPAKDSYFFSSSWDRNNPTDFLEVKKEKGRLPTCSCKTCHSSDSDSSKWISSSEGIIKNRTYHKDDFIRYKATDKTQLTCSFGQIITFRKLNGNVQIRVHRLGRISDRRQQSFCVENELFMTKIEEVVKPNMVLGICQVVHISQIMDHLTESNWLDQHPLSFYVQYQAESLNSPLIDFPSDEFHICDSCQKVQKNMERLKINCNQDGPLQAFDPFAGVGGFGIGLSRGCLMLTTHGVELDSNAAQTMRNNFPQETIVLNKDACQVLKHVFQKRAGVPRCGEVDLIYSGPPCQNDSTMNRNKNDKRYLAFTALSFVDILRPPFFIMESVPGFLQQKLGDGKDEIKAGELKLVLKVLHFLGYNVRGRMLHARSFGDPQTRNRFFIVATLPECGEFTFPEATHAFKGELGTGSGASLNKSGKLKVKAEVPLPGCALHETTTVSGALSDLPLFDWSIPGEQHGDESRAKDIATVSCDPDEHWGIQDATFRYTSPPMNNFQKRARRGLGLSDPQPQHFTKHFKPYIVKNVCDVPFLRRADYHHIDQANLGWLFRDPASSKSIHGYNAGGYTRLDPDGYFGTTVTNVGPTAKQAKVLHHKCKRILTVREFARTQGFPDDFVFYSETDRINDYQRQIGNSVAFGVSAALGRSIQEVVFRRWLKKNGESF